MSRYLWKLEEVDGQYIFKVVGVKKLGLLRKIFDIVLLNINETRSRIVFKTAGVLLEQMRDKGMAALQYKVIILDEVHERSVESDLVLACIKQFLMKKQDFRSFLILLLFYVCHICVHLLEFYSFFCSIMKF